MPQMTKVQRNRIVRALVAGNLDPAECELDYGKESYTVGHAPSGSAITWTLGPTVGNLCSLKTRIGTDPARSSATKNDFEIFAAMVSKWAADVREWVDIPDLWELSRSANAFVPGQIVPSSENTQFTPDEQQEISAQLKAIAESVKENYDLTAEQSAKLDEKFEEAEKASQRMGRKDWGLLFGGAVFSLILADVITPGVAGHILVMIEHGIGHLFAGGTPSVRGVLSGGDDLSPHDHDRGRIPFRDDEYTRNDPVTQVVVPSR